MTSPILALRAALAACAEADAALAALIGGPVRLHDEPPRAAEPVYIVFGDVVARDWSSAGDRGHEQELALTVWARPGSAASAVLVAERLAALIDGAELSLSGHRLVDLTVTALALGRDRDSGLARAELRLRAVTETA